ncbi:MAG: hypothetical protein IKJ91_03725 [Clostridia bacterium]|nr:hypothetical protein [Clostridia bacterium]
MTARWAVRAAMTEERSKAEIKASALRRSDETQSFCQCKEGLEERK